MALLLAMYQKMRLIREKNQLTLDLTKYSSKLDRVTKNIERVQKRYTSLFSQLESRAKCMQSQATMAFQNMAGLGCNSVNPMNYTGVNGFVMNYAGNMMQQAATIMVDGKETKFAGINANKFQSLMTEYIQNGKLLPKPDPKNKGKYIDGEFKNCTAVEAAAFTQALQAGQMMQQQAQMWVQQNTQNYQNNVSIWLDAEKARLEAQQDAMLEPLQYEETMMELEKEQADQKLKRINAQIESYDQLVSQEAQNSAPKFGLG